MAHNLAGFGKQIVDELRLSIRRSLAFEKSTDEILKHHILDLEKEINTLRQNSLNEMGR